MFLECLVSEAQPEWKSNECKLNVMESMSLRKHTQISHPLLNAQEIMLVSKPEHLSCKLPLDTRGSAQILEIRSHEREQGGM